MPLTFIASIASQLREATASTAVEVSEQVLARLVERFDLQAGFLRHNDHQLRASFLIAQWPPRIHVEDPDAAPPVCFDCGPLLALGDGSPKPIVIGPDELPPACRRCLTGPNRGTPASVVIAPLVSSETITGTLGAVISNGTAWKPELVNTLEVVAGLFAELQLRLAAEARLRHLAEHDDLTGLLNRRALVMHLSGRLVAGQPGPVPVVYLDLDRLKSVNDCLGHAAGDWYLKNFAQRLTACAPSRGMFGRLGGDEFVFVPNDPMPLAAAEALAGELREALCERLEIDGHCVTRSVSIGVAVGVPGRDDSTGLLQRADDAVLTAKRAGGNQVVVANDLSLETLSKMLHSKTTRRCDTDVGTEALVLHYLPEVDLSTGAIVAVEALVRWRHPVRGLLLPNEFIGLTETTGLSCELARWVAQNACADFSRWRARGVGRDAVLCLNVAPLQLAGHGFVRTVTEIIDEFGIDAGSLRLELAPRAMVPDIECTQRTLAQLKDVGIRIAIDDFGTGYAVLPYLKSLPIDTLKIDRGFITRLGTNGDDLAIVRAIIGLAEAFGLEVVAEGVETPIAALTLRRHGCHLAQGFSLSPPVPGSEMEAMLAGRRLPLPFSARGEAPSADTLAWPGRARGWHQHRMLSAQR